MPSHARLSGPRPRRLTAFNKRNFTSETRLPRSSQLDQASKRHVERLRDFLEFSTPDRRDTQLHAKSISIYDFLRNFDEFLIFGWKNGRWWPLLKLLNDGIIRDLVSSNSGIVNRIVEYGNIFRNCRIIFLTFHLEIGEIIA